MAGERFIMSLISMDLARIAMNLHGYAALRTSSSTMRWMAEGCEDLNVPQWKSKAKLARQHNWTSIVRL